MIARKGDQSGALGASPSSASHSSIRAARVPGGYVGTQLVHDSGGCTSSFMTKGAYFAVQSPQIRLHFVEVPLNDAAKRLQKHLNSAPTTPSRVLVIICVHGFPECGGYVLLEKNKFHRSKFEMTVPTRSVGGAVTFLSTACHSGYFLSPRWTTFCSVPRITSPYPSVGRLAFGIVEDLSVTLLPKRRIPILIDRKRTTHHI
jgi:hypothetical protein